MFPQLSNAASYPVKDFSNTTVSKPGFFKRLSQRKETKTLEAASEKKMSKKSNSLNAPYFEGIYIKASPARF